MPKMNAKGQIILPVDMGEAVGLKAGDNFEAFIVDDEIHLVKKVPGAAKGILKGTKIKSLISDKESRDSVLS